MSVAPQTSRVGDYELLAKLGEGGMGAVYKARQVSLDRTVALKVLPRRLANNKEYTERFLREARATAKLNHANIVAGIDVGFADGYYYFAMELVEGVTLKSRIKNETRLREKEVLRIGAAIASALAHAHAAGIIHRDIKPDNILLDVDGTPKVADLGLAKGSAEDSGLTQDGSTVGTPHYMAPEQARGDALLDGRADIYALGCTLYHAATGKTPFDAPTTAVVMVKHINEKMPHPQTVCPELSDDFCNILAHMLARSPFDRYKEMSSAASDMETMLKGRSLTRSRLPANKLNFLPLEDEDPNETPVERMQSRKRIAPAAPGDRPSRSRPRGVRAQSVLPLAGIAALALIALAVFLRMGAKPAAPIALNNEKIEKRPADDKPGIEPVPQPKIATDDDAVPEPALPAPTPATAMPALPAGYTSLFNGRSIDNWTVTAPAWSVSDGCLHGAGTDGANAIMMIPALLPHDFSLAFNITCEHNCHFGWSVPGEKFSEYLYKRDGNLLYGRYQNNKMGERIALMENKVTGASQNYRITVRGANIEFEVDGVVLLNSTCAVPKSAERRDFFFVTGGTSTLTSRYIGWRDLTSSTSTPVASSPKPAAATALFDGATTNGWNIYTQSWTTDNGCLVGTGLKSNAYLSRDRCLPSDFVLSFNVASERDMHLTWSVPGEAYSEVLAKVGKDLRFKRYYSSKKSEELGVAENKLTANAQDYRITVRRGRIEVEIDSVKVLGAVCGIPSAPGMRDLSLFVGSGSTARFKNLFCAECPSTPAAALQSILFDGKTLDGWIDKLGGWSFENGWMVGRQVDRNLAPARRLNSLPGNFELSLTAVCEKSFHFGWTTDDKGSTLCVCKSNTSLRLVHLAVDESGAEKTAELASVPNRLTASAHDYRVAVRGTRVEIDIDGVNAISSDKGVAGRPRRDFAIWGGPEPVKLKNIVVRELSGSVPAVKRPAVAPDTPEGAKARLAYSAFADQFLAALRGFDSKTATSRLADATKDAALKPLSIQLNEDRQMLEWLRGLEAVEQEGAMKLKDVDDFELPMAKGGAPMRVGRKAPFQLTTIANGALQLSSAGVAMPISFRQISPEARIKLAAGALPRDADGLLRAAFAMLLLPKTSSADLKAALAKAKEAGASLENIQILERWIGGMGESAQNSDAQAAWEKLQITAATKQWKQLKAALSEYNASHGNTAFFQAHRIEYDALQRKIADAEAPDLPAEERVNRVAAKLRELNPASSVKMTTRIEGSKVIELSMTTDGVTDISPIRDLSSLKTLQFIGTSGPVKSQSPLSNLEPLRGLELTRFECGYHPQVVDISVLKGMPLTRLSIHNTRVSDLSPLQGAPIEELFIFSTPVTNLAPLKGMPLKTLSCAGTKITDVAHLQGLPLETLNINWTQVDNISLLKDLPLKELHVSRTRVTDLSPIKNAKLAVFQFSPRPETAVDVIRQMATLTTINGMNTNEFWKRYDDGTLPKE